MSETLDLAVIPEVTALPAILAADQFDILGKLKKELAGYVPDASTPKGRDEIGSKAKKVGAAKQELLRLAGTLKEDAQAHLRSIQAEEKLVRENCDAIRDAILAPRERYLQIERDRVAGHEAELAGLVESPSFYDEHTPSQDFALRLNWLRNYPDRNWQEFGERAANIFASEIDKAERAMLAAIKREAEAAELARLREAEAKRQAEESARAQAEREARIAAEAADRAKVEAEQAAERAAAEAQRKADEAAEHARQQIEAEKRRAEQADAVRLAEIERTRRQHEADLAAAAERERQAEAARIAAAEQAKRDQAAAVDAERRRAAAQQEAIYEADRKRAADVQHRSQIMRAAKEGLMQFSLTEDQAREVVKAIVAGSVPHVKMEF